MSRTAVYFAALTICLALMAVAALVRTAGLAIAAALVLGLTSIVFARELSESEGTGNDTLIGSRGAREKQLVVFGAILVAASLAAGVVVLS